MLVPKLPSCLSEPWFSPKRGGNHECPPFRSENLCFPQEGRRVSESVEETSGLWGCQPLPHLQWQLLPLEFPGLPLRALSVLRQLAS